MPPSKEFVLIYIYLCTDFHQIESLIITVADTVQLLDTVTPQLPYSYINWILSRRGDFVPGLYRKRVSKVTF